MKTISLVKEFNKTTSIFSWIVMVCIVLFASTPDVMAQKESAEKVKLGDNIPEIYLNSEVYGNITPADLKGKVVLISLFATWCPPCQLELAEVQKELYPKYSHNSDFKLLVVGREHTDEDLKKYNKKKNFSFPLYPDPKREVFSLFADQSIPRMYLFDKSGKLIYTSSGFTKEEFDVMMEKIEKAL